MANAGESSDEEDFYGFDFIDGINATRNAQELRDATGNLSESDIELSISDSDGDDDEPDQNNNQFVWEYQAENMAEPEKLEYRKVNDVGPRHDLGFEADPVEYFKLFLCDGLFGMLRDQTNLFARQKQAENGPDAYWKYETSAEEIQAFVGINMVMALNDLPEISSYWNEDPFIGNRGIQACMTKNRFEKILQYFHFNDNTKMPGRDDAAFDHLFKVRPVVDTVLARSRDLYVPRQDLSVDEMMIGYKGRCYMRQYCPAKPTKYGLKAWACCEASTGYTLNFEMYTGKARDGRVHHGLGYDSVWKMTKPFHRQWHHVAFDNYFTSPKLMVDLAGAKTYSTGTVRVNRKGCPDRLKKLPKKQRGESVFAQTTLPDDKKLTAVVWQDKKPVNMLSTMYGNAVNTIARRVGRNALEFPCPEMVKKYNQTMGGVDLADQRMSYYRVGRPSKKWYMYVWWFCVNMSLVNAWLIYSQSHLPATQGKAKKKMWEFFLEVAKSMMGTRSFREAPAKRSAPVMSDSTAHRCVRLMEGKRGKRHCVQCKKDGRRTARGRHIETTTVCDLCHISLCKVGCFQQHLVDLGL